MREGARILEELDGEREGEEAGRRFWKWPFFRGVAGSLVDRIMDKLHEKVATSCYLRYSYTYRLRNFETGGIMLFHKTTKGSPWIQRLEPQARDWVQVEDEKRLSGDQIERPNTKWVFIRFISVEVRVVVDRQAPLLGTGPLPSWLRRKPGMYSLDTYGDNLCLFRCIAVHRGARADCCTRQARALAREIYKSPETCPGVSQDELRKVEQHFRLGIRVYEPQESGDWLHRRHPAHYEKVGTPPMTIGVYEGHAFLIRDIQKLAKKFVCGDCNARFTQSNSLHRHADRCTQGETKVVCKGEKVEAPPSAFEKAFYPQKRDSIQAVQWLEYEALTRGIHIHHQLCGHGGERMIEGFDVDGYDPISKTVFQFNGCLWHGCKRCFPSPKQRQEQLLNLSKKKDSPVTREIAYQQTLKREAKIRDAGYRLVVRWQHEWPKPWRKDRIPERKTETYPHAIVYDFESYLDKSSAKKPTADLTIEGDHVPISVSISDTLDPTPEHLCVRESKLLVEEFVRALERRAQRLRADVRARFLPDTIELLPKKYREAIEEWCLDSIRGSTI